MSHFTVALITKGKPTSELIDEMLAPYDENKEVEHFTSREELIKKTRAEIEKYEKTVYAEYLADKEKYISESNNEAHIKYISEEFPKKLAWTDEECYQYAIRCEDAENICDDGSLCSTYNPNSKWDWYSIGGRYVGMLSVKLGADYALGQKSLLYGPENPYKSDDENIVKCDCARIKDLVFPEKEVDAQKARRFWEIYIEGDEPRDEKERELVKYVFCTKKYYISTYKDKETFVRCRSNFYTYAVITKDGEWHAVGKMGWFGISHEDDTVAWIDGYQKLVLDCAEDDDYITIIDCHI
ncbi:MAG: hypothetical protein K2L51_01035 [Clostridiales bacterium]|nr:hypothetical protein [Clostridiales bacterium]